MGFLSKVKNKTENRAADKIADGIVNAVFKKKDKKDKEEHLAPAPAEPQPQVQQAAPQPAPAAVDEEAARAQAQAMAANTMSSEQMQMAMGAAYNTKRCPECQAVCINSPVSCPYCGADLKAVKPMTPEELEKLGGIIRPPGRFPLFYPLDDRFPEWTIYLLTGMRFLAQVQHVLQELRSEDRGGDLLLPQLRGFPEGRRECSQQLQRL